MVSVLINNHNYGKYIGQAIESVINQTYKDFEIIVVDGDSSDNSREVIMSYVQKYPQIITAVFKPTSGQAAAFNVGFQLSKGDIIAFLDSDDFFYETKLERIVKEHERYDVIGHGKKMHNAKGQLVDVYASVDIYEDRPRLLKEYGYVYTYGLITSCISMKREIAEKVLPMPETHITFADCYVKILAQYYSNIKYLCEPLAYYRIHEKQKTQSYEDGIRLHLFLEKLHERVFEEINQKLEQLGEKLIPTADKHLLTEGIKIANPGLDIVPDGKYVLYGVGAHSYAINRCMNLFNAKFIYAVDSDSKKWGTYWQDIQVVSLEDVLNHRDEYEKIIIGSSNYQKEIEKILTEKGLEPGKDFQSFQSLPNDF